MNQSVIATSRVLDKTFRIIWMRIPRPCWSHLENFPIRVDLSHETVFSDAEAWLLQNIGPLDHSWSYLDTGSVLFRTQADATQFTLTFF